jgi:hypothetical protein
MEVEVMWGYTNHGLGDFLTSQGLDLRKPIKRYGCPSKGCDIFKGTPLVPDRLPCVVWPTSLKVVA